MRNTDCAPLIKLEKSKLELNGGFLILKNAKEEPFARFKVSEIDEVLCESGFDYASLVLCLFALACALLAYFYVQNNVLGTFCYLIAIVLVGLGTLGGVKTEIVVGKKNGDQVRIPVQETTQEAQAFVASLRELMSEM